MKWLWISGWAVPPAWLAAEARRAWPGAEHRAVSPAAAAEALAAGNYDALGGYSLGALWLLRHAATVPKNLPVVLLAPIFAFPSECGLGGRIPLAQLRMQRRQLRKYASAALTVFFQHAGLAALNLHHPADEISPAETATLDEGLNWLETWSVPPPAPAGWQGWIGAQDLLLDAEALRKLWPGLHVVPGVGHEPSPLLHAAAEHFSTHATQ